MIKRIINYILKQRHYLSSDRYIKFLRSKGIKIGNNCIVFDPKSASIDFSRPSLLEIGDKVFLHKGITIMTHDFASYVFINKYNEFIPSHGKIKIGNNVWFGCNCTVLKGVTIGNNCIIGTGSVVTRNIPDNSVAIGSPAKVICSIDEYFEKRKREYKQEAIEFAKSIRERYQRSPRIEDFYDDFPAFVNGKNYQHYDYPYHHIFTLQEFEIWKKNHQSYYKTFEEFIHDINNYK